MPRKLPEEFEGKELAPLCLASSPDEAKKIESVLDGAGIDYTFEITPILNTSVFSILFSTTKEGVMFIVPSEQYELCLKLFEEAGLSSLIIE